MSQTDEKGNKIQMLDMQKLVDAIDGFLLSVPEYSCAMTRAERVNVLLMVKAVIEGRIVNQITGWQS